ncbi:MAG: hypothetical protein HRT72_01845 [Flavobacteriales bacterium]|nr:hypothetical protein [Flavobacteriales bacterium]
MSFSGLHTYILAIAFLLPTLFSTISFVDNNELEYEIESDWSEKKGKESKDKSDEIKSLMSTKKDDSSQLVSGGFKFAKHGSLLLSFTSEVFTPPPEC